MIRFYSVKEKYGEFSNWARAEFDMDGCHFINSEQGFMFLKAQLFNDTEHMQRILDNGNPLLCKRMGRMVKPFDHQIFDENKFQMMVKVNLAKFSQNENLKELLLSTGDEIIAEASPTDRIWGIGMSADDPDFNSIENWKGQNLLGKALMEVRNLIRTDNVAE